MRVARVRAQAAIALLDLMPEGAARRVDAAMALALAGPRRALLVERGILALDSGGADDRIVTLRALVDRLPALNEGVEAIVVGPGEGTSLSARDGAVVVTPEDPGQGAGRVLLWGGDVRSPPGDGWTTAVARGLATAAVARAVGRSEALRAQVERDGGISAVAALAAMLVLDGPLAVETAAARLLAGRKESAASLSDAIGALALFAPGQSAGGPAVRVGPSSRTSGPPSTELGRVSLAPSGVATSFRLEGHAWAFERDAGGAISGLRRDGQPVTASMLASVRP
jgi:hypothetical protein